MTSVVLGPIFARPLHPQSWNRPPGNRDYRVTNTFDGPDLVNGGAHLATDAGNFGVNEPLRAPASCLARPLKHFDGALGVEMSLGGGVTIALWHLNRTDPPAGRWTRVQRGERIGLTGNTGAKLADGSPMAAHTHIRAERSGVPFDVEPYLFGAPLTLEDDDVQVPYGLKPLTTAVLAAGNRVRANPATTEGSRVVEQATRVQVFGAIDRANAPWELGGVKGTTWYFIGLDRESGYVATPLLPTVDLSKLGLETIDNLPAADCSALENKVAAAQTAIRGAQQAHGVESSALAAAEAALA